MLVIYDYDSNFIHVEPMPSKSGPSILAAYASAHALLTSRGLKPALQRLDNEASEALQTFMAEANVDFQLAPPYLHRLNAAERAIQTFKHHFIAGLCSTDRNFPLHLWARLLSQAFLSLNLLRTSRLNPYLSAWAQVHGNFDYNRTPLAPPGTRVLVHENPQNRETWAPHAVEGWYIGPALAHYRCYRVWVNDTSAERVANTLAWFPSQVAMPSTSSLDLATAAAQDLLAALLHPSAASPLPSLDLTQRAALFQLADIFAQVTSPVPDTPTTLAPAALVPRVPHQSTPVPAPTAVFPSPINALPPALPAAPTYIDSTGNPNQRRRKARAAKKLLASSLPLPAPLPDPPLQAVVRPPAPAPAPSTAPAPLHPDSSSGPPTTPISPPLHTHNTRSTNPQRARINCAVATSDGLPSLSPSADRSLRPSRRRPSRNRCNSRVSCVIAGPRRRTLEARYLARNWSTHRRLPSFSIPPAPKRCTSSRTPVNLPIAWPPIFES